MSRARRRSTTRSAARNSRGSQAATLACGELFHATKKLHVHQAIAPHQAASVESRKRRRSANIARAVKARRSSADQAAPSRTPSSMLGESSGPSTPGAGDEASGVPPELYGSQSANS